MFIVVFNLTANCQQFVFATLKGSPMNTSGWNLVGDAKVGDTPGDPNNAKDELIICHDSAWNSGACFFKTPINLGLCSKWTVEFDYRIFDGTAADGMAFCFLTNPPTGYLNAKGCGIPSKPVGIMVVLDIFKNCGDPAPKLELAYGDGSQDYDECTLPSSQIVSSLSILRGNNYNHMKIIYNNGNIFVYINGTFMITGYYPINYQGYLGFTSSTGMLTDNHSIKNLYIYTSMPISNAGPDISACTGVPATIGVTPKTNYNYFWSPSTGLNDPNSSNPKITINNITGAQEVFTYIVTTDSISTGCKTSDTVKITVNKSPQIDIGIDTVICEGSSIQLDAGAGYSDYLWSTKEKTQTIKVANSGQYKVQITDKNQCEGKDSINIGIKLKPVFSLGKDTTICEGQSIMLHINYPDATNILWQDGKTLPDYALSKPGTYWAKVTNSCGTKEDSIVVNFTPTGKIDLGTDTTLCFDSFILKPNSYYHNCIWSTGDTNKAISVVKTGTYSLIAYGADGCKAEGSKNIVKQCNYSIYVPNAFIRNGSIPGNEFKAVGQHIVEFKMIIFNKWGMEIKEINNIDDGWDGTYANKSDVPEGMYVWLITYKALEGDHITYTQKLYGTVTIIR